MVRCSYLGVAVHFANPLPETDFQNRSSESLPQIFQSASMVHTHDVSGIFTCVHVADDDGPGAAIVPRTNMPGMITIASPAGPMFTLFVRTCHHLFLTENPAHWPPHPQALREA